MTRISSIKKVFTLIASIIIAGASHIYAAEQDLGVLVPDVEYTITQFATVTGQYTPTQTGPVKFIYSQGPLQLYSSADHSDDSAVYGTHAYTSSGQVVSYSELQAGTTYYIYDRMTMNGGTLIIREGTTELEITGTTPVSDPTASGYAPLSVSNNYTVSIFFNFPVTCGNAFLIAGAERVSINAVATGSTIGCDISSAMMEFYRSGSLKEGDTVTVRVLQVKDALDSDNKYNTNGKVEIDFTVAAKPAELTATTNVSFSNTDYIFDSYYLPDDPRAIVELEFDTLLSTSQTPQLTLKYGDTDNLDLGVYREVINGHNEGNKAIFDLSGKIRRPIDMLPGSTADTQPTHMYGSFGNIYSADGQRAFTNKASNPTSFSASYRLNVLQYAIAADFTPVRGGKLNPGDEMEIWIRNGDMIRFDAVLFAYTSAGQDATVEVPYSDIKVETDPYSDDAMLYTFTVPAFEADPGTKVTVTLAGLMCADGLDHSTDITAVYEGSQSAIIDITVSGSDRLHDVYNAAGVLVLRSATEEQINALPAGFYIANGKKFIVR